MAKSKSLKELILKSNKIGDEGMVVIAEALNGFTSHVELINLSQTNISCESFRALLLHLRNNSRMKTLIVDKNNLHSVMPFSAIKDTISQQSSKMEVLSCAHCNLSDSFGLAFAEGLKRNRFLKRVNFYGNEMTCRSLSNLAAALRDSTNSLVHLNLGKNNLKDKGGVVFADALRFNR